MSTIRVGPGIEIPEEALTLRASRSSGPGGQNVNKVSTRMTLEFDLQNSPLLSDEQKARVTRKLRSRITREGVLQLSSQEHRTQSANREAVIRRFSELLTAALREPRRRRATRVPKVEKEKRVDAKRRTAEKKAGRRFSGDE